MDLLRVMPRECHLVRTDLSLGFLCAHQDLQDTWGNCWRGWEGWCCQRHATFSHTDGREYDI